MAENVTEKLECDLVMRGGITSGIVYPRAIAKLAETYKFRSIGGTSAGAIAAAGTAAAAYGARHGKGHFQDRLKNLPSELSQTPGRSPGTKGKKTVLERLFQPQAKTRRLFDLLMSGLGRGNKLLKALAVAWALCRNYWQYAVAGAAIALTPLLALALTSSLGGELTWLLVFVGLIPALVFVLVAASIGVLCDVVTVLRDNDYGMCSGSSNNVPDDVGVLPLTDWLHAFFQSVANRDVAEKPLTFGDLWDNDNDPEKPRDIELVLMTTNVSRGISHRLPFIEASWGQLFFKEEDFRRLFPERVVKHMTDHAAEVRQGGSVDTHGFIPLPAPADLPILLGARMSLSFPFLLSAVPLYAANFEAKKNGKFPLERCWFSDGGLTSNFPIHFFDTPLPSRPTFGINLVPHEVEASEIDEDEEGQTLTRIGGVGLDGVQDSGVPEEWKMVWMPSRNSSGIGSAARFNRIEGVLGFFGAMFDTARNWADTELLAMPGYRERVVHVKLASDEGGMNLNMTGKLIDDIGKRGEKAGELLAARYAPTPSGDETLTDPQRREPVQLTWDNHRWIRYRATMAAFEDLARRFRSTWQNAAKSRPWRAYEALVDRGDSKPKSYPFKTGQRSFAIDATKKFVDFVAAWTPPDETFDRGDSSKEGRSPRPKPTLRMMPPGSNDPRAERPD